MNWKRIRSGNFPSRAAGIRNVAPSAPSQAELKRPALATVAVAPRRPTNTASTPPAANPARSQPGGEGETYLYPEDLADLDEFDFGGAAFRGKTSSAGAPAANANKAIELGGHRPLSARDLPRHQQSALRFVEARPLPLRSPGAASAPQQPRPATKASGQPQSIEPRALPLRSRRKPQRPTKPD